MTIIEFLESKFGGCQWPRDRYLDKGLCPKCGAPVEEKEIAPGEHIVICVAVFYEECDYGTGTFSTPEEAWEAHFE